VTAGRWYRRRTQWRRIVARVVTSLALACRRSEWGRWRVAAAGVRIVVNADGASGDGRDRRCGALEAGAQRPGGQLQLQTLQTAPESCPSCWVHRVSRQGWALAARAGRSGAVGVEHLKSGVATVRLRKLHDCLDRLAVLLPLSKCFGQPPATTRATLDIPAIDATRCRSLIERANVARVLCGSAMMKCGGSAPFSSKAASMVLDRHAVGQQGAAVPCPLGGRRLDLEKIVRGRGTDVRSGRPD